MAYETINPGENRVDLHAHSTASDGTYSPTEIVQLAKERNLRAIALTDHDTVAGVAEAQQAGAALGVEVLPGIEISADYADTGAHILGYLVDPASPALQEVIDWFIAERETRNQAIVDKLAADGFPISIPELKAKFPHTMLGRPHIGQLLVEKGCVGSVTEAMDRWLWDGQPYFMPRQHLPAAEAIRLIKKAGGVAVIAHPLEYGYDKDGVEQLIQTGYELGAVGVECHYSGYTAEEETMLTAFATARGMVVTGGSDFHGPRKPYQLGTGTGTLRVYYATVEALKARQAAAGATGVTPGALPLDPASL